MFFATHGCVTPCKTSLLKSWNTTCFAPPRRHKIPGKPWPQPSSSTCLSRSSFRLKLSTKYWHRSTLHSQTLNPPSFSRSKSQHPRIFKFERFLGGERRTSFGGQLRFADLKNESTTFVSAWHQVSCFVQSLNKLTLRQLHNLESNDE